MHRGYSVPGVVTGKPIAHRRVRSVVRTRPARASSTRSPTRLAAAAFQLDGLACGGPGLRQRRRGDRPAAPSRPARASSRSPMSMAASPTPTDSTCRSCARHLSEHGTIAGAPGTRPIDNDELFGLDVDVLVLAALEGQITAGKCRHRPGADPRRGRQRPGHARRRPDPPRNGVVVLPDILCNAGGVIVSYFEWAQNRAALAWTLDEVNERLRRQILAPPTRSGRGPAPTASIRAWPPRPSRSSVSPRRRGSAGSTRKPVE